MGLPLLEVTVASLETKVVQVVVVVVTVLERLSLVVNGMVRAVVLTVDSGGSGCSKQGQR